MHTRGASPRRGWKKKEDGAEDQLANLLHHEVALLPQRLPPLLPIIITNKVGQSQEDNQLPLA